MRKLIIASILAVSVIALSVHSVLADTWEFKFPVTITDTSNVTRSYYPVLLPNGLTSLSDYTSTGLDTNMMEAASARKYLMADSRIGVVIPNLPGGGRSNVDLYTGYSPSQTGFPIITGYGGYVTTNDAPNLEPAGNSSIEISGYWDTAASGTKKQGKMSAIEVISGNATSNVTAAIYDPLVSQTLEDTFIALGSAYNARAGQKFLTPTYNVVAMEGVDFYVRKNGLPTGNATLNVRRVSDDALLGTVGIIDVSTLTGALAYYTFTPSQPILVGSISFIISLDYSGGDAGNYVEVGWKNADVVAGQNAVNYTGGAWVNQAAWDATYRYLSIAQTSVSTTVASGEHTITATNNVTSFGMQVDGGAWTTTTAATVPDNTNNWTWGASNAMPYITYIKEWVGGNQQLYYAPNATISGTTLPDRAADATANDGVITWGTNSNVTITYGAMEASETTTVSSANATEPYTLPSLPTPSRWYGASVLSAAAADASFVGAFFYDNIHEQYVGGGIPTGTVYFNIFILAALAAFILIGAFTHSLAAGLAIAIFILFGGSQVGTAGAVPMWLPVALLVVELALIMAYKELA